MRDYFINTLNLVINHSLLNYVLLNLWSYMVKHGFIICVVRIFREEQKLSSVSHWSHWSKPQTHENHIQNLIETPLSISNQPWKAAYLWIWGRKEATIKRNKINELVGYLNNALSKLGLSLKFRNRGEDRVNLCCIYYYLMTESVRYYNQQTLALPASWTGVSTTYQSSLPFLCLNVSAGCLLIIPSTPTVGREAGSAVNIFLLQITYFYL